MGVRPPRRSASPGEDDRAARTYLLLIAAVFLIILLRLLFLQVVQQRSLFIKSLDNVLRTANIPPPRGTIYDRAGQPLALSKQTYGLLFIPPANLDSYLPPKELRRLLRIVDGEEYPARYYYLKRKALWEKKLTPADELLAQNVHPELDAALVRLQTQKPTIDEVTYSLKRTLAPLRDPALVGPFRDARKEIDERDYPAMQLGAMLTFHGRGQEYGVFVDALLAHLSQAGLRAEYGAHMTRLRRHYLEAARAAKAPDDALGPPEIVEELSREELAEKGDEARLLSVARTLCGYDTKDKQHIRGLYEDEFLLARWYLERSVLDDVNAPEMRLADINGLASYLSQAGYPKSGYLDLMQRLDTERVKSFTHEPLPVTDALRPNEWLFLAEHNDEFNKFIVEQYAFQRVYPLGPATTHLLGYTSAATEEQIKNNYDQSERSGRGGVESGYEERLRGTLGWRQVEISRQGIFMAETKLEAPKRGTDLYLSIDAGLQEKAHAVLGGRRGAAIVCALNPENRGEILALTSSPSFDATRMRDRGFYTSLLEDPWKPEVNRAYGASFAPGSTFKLVTLTAALQTGAISPGGSWYCPGKMTIGRRDLDAQLTFHCHERSAGHQYVDVFQALAESCDVAFYQIGLALNKLEKTDAPTEISQYAKEYGYGAVAGIPLTGEAAGTVPDREWKRDTFMWTRKVRRTNKDTEEQLWYHGDTLNYAIGQSFLLATPLQVLWSANTVAWDGARYPPRLLIASSAEHGLQRESAAEAEMTGLDPAVLDIVRRGMRRAVTEGTCHDLDLAGLQVCAKSGTAEVHKHKETHSWVVGFYPQDNPRYGFVVFFEHGGSSHDAAIPAAKLLLEFLRELDPLARNPEAQATPALSASLP